MQMKNWEPLVLGPALAMERIPGPVCFKVKFSSANLAQRHIIAIQRSEGVPVSKSPLFEELQFVVAARRLLLSVEPTDPLY